MRYELLDRSDGGRRDRGTALRLLVALIVLPIVLFLLGYHGFSSSQVSSAELSGTITPVFDNLNRLYGGPTRRCSHWHQVLCLLGAQSEEPSEDGSNAPTHLD